MSITFDTPELMAKVRATLFDSKGLTKPGVVILHVSENGAVFRLDDFRITLFTDGRESFMEYSPRAVQYKAGGRKSMTNAEHFDQQYLIELDAQIEAVRGELGDSARKWKESGLFYRLFNRDINKVIDRLEKLERMREKAKAEMVVKYGTGFEEIKDIKEKVQ